MSRPKIRRLQRLILSSSVTVVVDELVDDFKSECPQAWQVAENTATLPILFSDFTLDRSSQVKLCVLVNAAAVAAAVVK